MVARVLRSALPALVGLAICSWRITDRQIWRDEHATWWAATIPFDALLRLLSHVDAVIAPYYLLMRGFIAAIGDSPLALRMPSALAIALACVLLSALGKRLFDARAGFYAALLFAIVPSVSRYGQEARPYAFVLAICIAACLLLVRALERPSWQRFASYGAALVGLGGLHLVALCSLGAHALLALLWPGPEPRRRVLLFALTVLIALLTIAPLAYFGHQQVAQISWALAQHAALSELPRMLTLSPLVGKLIGLLALLSLFRAEHKRWFVAAWAVLPPALMYVTHPALHMFVARYLLFTLPAWCLLAALALDDFGYWLARKRAGRFAHEAAPTLVLCALFLLSRRAHDHARSEVSRSYDYASVANVLRRDASSADAIAFAGSGACDHWARMAMQYELRDKTLPHDVFVSRTQAERGWFAAEECDDFASCLPEETRRMWLVTCGNDPDVFSQLRYGPSRVLRSEFSVAQVRSFQNIQIARLERAMR